jgi:hypothetical protein
VSIPDVAKPESDQDETSAAADSALDPRRRAIRTRVSAALLAAGATAFVVSLSLPAVRLTQEGGGRYHVGGWTAATHHGPAGPTNGFLAAGFVVWALAHWFRSILAWYVGAAMAVYAVLFHAFVGAWPGYEGIERLYSGYWVWLAATAVIAAAFLTLPKPIRPPPGERLPRADVDRGRRGLAHVVAAVAVAALLVTHLLVPTSVGGREVLGPPPEHAWNGYESGPLHSEMQGSTRTRTLADGTTVQETYHHEADLAPLATAQFRRPGTAALELGLLALPLLWLAAATTRRAVWRSGGAAVAATTALVAFLWVDEPWPISSFGAHPLEVLWRGEPTALLVAFVLLPPRRAPAFAPEPWPGAAVPLDPNPVSGPCASE